MSITTMFRAALAAATLLLAPLDTAGAEDTPVAIAAAPDFRWGFKATWRAYAGEPEVSGGAQVVTGNNLAWDFDSGSYDPVTQTTHLEYLGAARWRGHKASDDGVPAPPGYSGEPDPYLLDVTLSDPQVTISRDESVVTVVASSRDLDTWEMIDYGRVPIVNLDAIGATPTIADGTTTWSNLAAAVTEQGNEAMAGFYRVGQNVDPVSFSYTGPGGAPDFSEHWDEPGKAVLKLVENKLFIDGTAVVNPQPLWIDTDNMIVHSIRSLTVSGVQTREIVAFGLEEMRQLGQPLVLPRTAVPDNFNSVVAYDSSEDRILYRAFGESAMPRWLKFNLETEQYEYGLLADPQANDTSFIADNHRLAWDPTRERGYRIELVVPPGVAESDFDNHEWRLFTYEEGEDGIWIKKSFLLPGFPSGQNSSGYETGTSLRNPVWATASDGSLIALASFREGLDETEKIPGAYRIVFDAADEQVDVDPLPIPDVYNTVLAGGVFSSVQTSADGHIALMRGSGDIVHCKIGAGGEVACDPAVSARDNVESGPYESWRFALDPADGTVWFGGVVSQKLAAFKDGEFRGAQLFKERHPKGGPVLVGDDGFVYAQTNNGGSAESGGSKTWGYGKFERVGFVPEVTAQPADEAVELGIGESSEQVTFASGAMGEPAPSRQWQVKAPGALKFANLDGETGPTLGVEATRDSDGSEYRAVYSNAAGKVASEAATLSVDYAPLVHQDPVSLEVTEGSAAEFAVLADGDPAPDITWQRRVGGFWQAIDPADDNFELDGQRLSVLETNTEQSGALFRVKVSNPLGTAFSKAAELTVEPAVAIPPGGLDLEAVSLEWAGNAEMQKAPPFGNSNFFSAGVSDGKQATYDALAGNAAVYQVAAAGAETLATWATRAAHVSAGGEQLVRLYGGEGRIEPDGSASVEWDGSFSVNFYGGLVPFTFTDPELAVDADGTGTLSADMSGCESSQANPNDCTPFAPVPDVTVASFSGIEVDPAAPLAIDPDYAGVEVDVPIPFAPQDRVAAGWGAWPQPFVDFHVKTGLSSYWYSSGGSFDPYKAPDPFTVDVDGGPPPSEPEDEGEPEPEGEGEQKPTPPAPGAPPRRPSAAPPAPGVALAQISAAGGRQGLTGKRLATLATLTCPGAGFCAVAAPRRVKLWIADRRHWVKVIAPRILDGGREGEVQVKLSKGQLRRLGRGIARGRMALSVRSEAGSVRRVIAVRIRKGGPVGGPRSGPVAPAPTLGRPAGAIDVIGVKLSWHPRDSWLRYASSGVAPGDGILLANGALGTSSTASPCPDRPSTSDAQLPYSISFTPKASWYDPVSGAAGIYGQGSVSFRWAAHGIDLTASDPEIEIGAVDSRAIFRFSGSGGTAYPDQRASLISLDPGAGPTVTNGGKTFAYNLMRGTLTADGVNVFAGFYTPPDNDEFGCVSVEFTTP